jgi:hypothetical protein
MASGSTSELAEGREPSWALIHEKDGTVRI